MVPKFLVFLTSTRGSTAGDVSMYALGLKVYDPKVGCFIVDTDTRVRAPLVHYGLGCVQGSLVVSRSVPCVS